MKNLRENFLLAALSVLLGFSFTGYKAYAQNKDNQDALQPVQGLTVFDAKGKRVGNVLGFTLDTGGFWGGAATVALRVGGELVILYVTPDGFTGSEHGFTKNMNPLYFESSGCTGAASMNPQTVNPALAPPHILHGTKLYAFDGPPRTVIVGSLGYSDIRDNPCQPVNPHEILAQPLRFLIDLGTQFQPPFTMK